MKAKKASKLLAWSTLLTAAIVASLSTVSIYQLNQMVERRNDSRLLLTQVKEQVSRLNALEWEGISKGKIDQNLDEELNENQQRTNLILKDLEQKDQEDQNVTLQNLFGLWALYRTKIDQVLKLVEQGKIEQARDIDADDIDEIYDDLYDEVTILEKKYVKQKNDARKIADAGTAFSLIFAAVIVGILAHRFNKNLQDKNQELKITLEELQQAQDQLIRQEKMAALGQLIAGVAHEINNPLGVIKASAGNTHKSLRAALAEMPYLHERLSFGEQNIFFKLVNQGLEDKSLTDSQESRVLKRKITAQLKEQGIENSRYIADSLMDIGIYEDFEFLYPLLKSGYGEWAIELAYNLTRSFGNSQMILNAVDRSSKIVFSLKNYARFDSGEKKKIVRVTDGLETVLELYYNQLKQNIQVIREYQEIPDILGYPDELIQVWTNLIHNAIQAMPSGGTLTITTCRQSNGIKVSIADTGSGMSAEVQEKIFDAFFTTKASGEGSGLGLHISQKIIHRHQGHVKVESQVGHTRFIVWLPIES